jgi:RNA-directed DNA polymerase
VEVPGECRFASPAASGSGRGSVPADPVRVWQHALYRAAKADPGRRFHALRDKIYRRDVLWRAWVTVYRNGGAPGIDQITLAEVERCGVDRLLEESAGESCGRAGIGPCRRIGC